MAAPGTRLTIAILGVVAGWTPGCRPERNVTEAEGAYRAVIDAYDDEDAAALWALSSDRTRELVGEAYAGLGELKALISDKFPVGRRKDALHAAGVALLDGTREPAGLFARVVRLEALNFDGGVRYGAEVVESQVDAEGGKAVFHTQAGQEWVLMRAQDGSWRSVHLEAVFESRLATVRSNLDRARAFIAKAAAHDAAVEARVHELSTGRRRPKAAAADADALAAPSPAAPPSAPERKADAR